MVPNVVQFVPGVALVEYNEKWVKSVVLARVRRNAQRLDPVDFS